MSRQITQPINQVRLTNVAVVRLSKGGKRFEVACYKNKIVDYRNGKEHNIDEVLQAETIFSNVSKGVLASKTQLKQIFGTSDESLVIEDILRNGQVQISDKERLAYYENVWLEVANLVSEKCVNPANNRRYTPDTIRQALKIAEFSPHPTRSAKQQFLDCVKILMQKNILPIQRAKMHLRMTIDKGINDETISFLDEVKADITCQGTNSPSRPMVVSLDLLLDPSLYRDLEHFCNKQDVEARLEVVQLTVIEEGDAGLEIDLARRNLVSDKDPSVSDAKSQYQNVEEILLEDINTLNSIFSSAASLNKDQSENDYDVLPQNTRKSAKKAQKKSKKSKRREKEEEIEREARREKETLRQAERASRLKETGTHNYMNESNESTKSSGNQEKLSSCNTCGGSFTKAQYRAHFKSDWHRYNINLKMQGASCISEEEFKLADIDFF